MAIDVGAAAINRDYLSGQLVMTFVGKENAANATGTINHIEVYMAYGGDIEVGSFYEGASNVLSTRGSSGVLTVVAGLNTFDAPGHFTAFNISTGDYIGLAFQTDDPAIDRANTGDGYWYLNGDQIPATDVEFTWGADRTMSLYASGTESGADVTVTPDAIALTAGVQAPTLNYDYVVAVSALALTGTLNAPTICYDTVISVLAQALAIALQDPEVGMFDGDYEEEQRPDTAYTELSKTATPYTELEKPTTTHTELSSNLTEYTSIKWFGGYGGASYGYSPYGGAYGEYTEESKPSSDYTELTKPTTVYTEE